MALSLSFCVFLACMIYLFVIVCFVLPWTVESFPVMFWHWRNKLKWAPFEFFAPSPLLRVRSWLHPFKGHCEQKAMRDEGVIYVAGHPPLNRSCARLPGFIRPRNGLYCVGWGATCAVGNGSCTHCDKIHAYAWKCLLFSCCSHKGFITFPLECVEICWLCHSVSYSELTRCTRWPPKK